MTKERGKLDLGQLRVVADILMGAAHADGQFDGDEMDMIGKVLVTLLGGEALPDEIVAHLEAFDADAFDLAKTVEALELRGPNDRKALLGLVGKVTDADDVHDLREDEYIRRLAELLGAPDEELAGLTVEIEWIESLEQPPPLPPEAAS